MKKNSNKGKVVNQPSTIEQQILSTENVMTLQEYYEYFGDEMLGHSLGTGFSLAGFILCTALIHELNGKVQLLAAGGSICSLVSAFIHTAKLGDDARYRSLAYNRKMTLTKE